MSLRGFFKQALMAVPLVLVDTPPLSLVDQLSADAETLLLVGDEHGPARAAAALRLYRLLCAARASEDRVQWRAFNGTGVLEALLTCFARSNGPLGQRTELVSQSLPPSSSAGLETAVLLLACMYKVLEHDILLLSTDHASEAPILLVNLGMPDALLRFSEGRMRRRTRWAAPGALRMLETLFKLCFERRLGDEALASATQFAPDALRRAVGLAHDRHSSEEVVLHALHVMYVVAQQHGALTGAIEADESFSASLAALFARHVAVQTSPHIVAALASVVSALSCIDGHAQILFDTGLVAHAFTLWARLLALPDSFSLWSDAASAETMMCDNLWETDNDEELVHLFELSGTLPLLAKTEGAFLSGAATRSHLGWPFSPSLYQPGCSTSWILGAHPTCLRCGRPTRGTCSPASSCPRARRFTQPCWTFAPAPTPRRPSCTSSGAQPPPGCAPACPRWRR